MRSPGLGTGRIDRSRPVADHPLNHELRSWWLATPGLSGGARLYDLAGGDHGERFGSPQWVPGPSPGLGALRFDGSSTYAEASGASYGTGSFSVGCAFRKRAGGVFGGLVSRVDASDAAGWSLNVNNDDTIDFYCANSPTYDIAHGPAVTDQNWHTAFGVRSGGTVRVYVDGVLYGSVASSGVNCSTSPALEIGLYRASLAHVFNGDVGGVWLYDRGLSDAEVWALHDQWRRGYPDVLRRYPDRTAVFLPGTAAGATYTATAALSAGAATASGSATFTAPVYTATAALSAGPAALSASATFTAPVYTAAAAVAAGAATLSGSASHTTPTYTASGALPAGPATLAGSAVYSSSVSVGSAALSAGAATASGSATFTAPVYTASGALATAPANLAGTATFTAPVYTASGTLSAGPASLSGSASFVPSVSSGSAVLSAGAATLAGLATYTSAPVAPTPGGTFRRTGDLSRAFRRHGDPSRVFRSYYPR